MATASSEEPLPGPSGYHKKTKVDCLVYPAIFQKVAACISKDWKWLGREMGIEDTKLENIRLDHTSEGVQEMSYQLLQEWQRRMPDKATVNILADYLMKIDRAELSSEILKMAKESKTSTITPQTEKIFQTGTYSSRRAGSQELCSQASPISQKDLNRTWAAVKSTLKIDNSRLQIPRIPWLKDWEINIEDYYVDLTMNNKNEEATPVHLHEIFNSFTGNVFVRIFNFMSNMLTRSNELTTRILIEGPAGYGKSTLARKLCFDHAKGKKYIGQFEVVLLLRLREFKETLEEMITNAIQLINYSSEQVLETMTQNQSKILIILDGFDELHPGHHRHIVPLLKGKQFPQATIIVTSRDGCIKLEGEDLDSSITKLLHCVDRRILIKGVTGKNRIKFLQLYLKGYSFEKCDAFITLADKKFGLSDTIKENLFDCPLFLLLLVTVAEETDIASLTTKTQLYKYLFNFMLRRMSSKESKMGHQFDFFEFVDGNAPAYVEMLCRFGSFAGEALDNIHYSFSEEEILRCTNNDRTILKLGILMPNDSKTTLKRKSWFEPLHLSFLEFSFAYSVWVSVFRTQHFLSLSNPKYIINIVSLLRRYKLAASFLCGLCGKQLPTLFSAFTYNHDSMVTIFDILERGDFLAESQLEFNEFLKAFLPLIPTELIIYDVNEPLPILLKYTLMHAVQTRKNQRIILDQNFIHSSEQLGTQQLNIKPYIRDLDSEFSHLNNEFSRLNTALSQLNSEVLVSKFAHMDFKELVCNFPKGVSEILFLDSPYSHLDSKLLDLARQLPNSICQFSHLASKLSFSELWYSVSEFWDSYSVLQSSTSGLKHSDSEILHFVCPHLRFFSELLIWNSQLLLSVSNQLLSISEILLSDSEILLSDSEILLSDSEILLSDSKQHCGSKPGVLSDSELLLSDSEHSLFICQGLLLVCRALSFVSTFLCLVFDAFTKNSGWKQLNSEVFIMKSEYSSHEIMHLNTSILKRNSEITSSNSEILSQKSEILEKNAEIFRIIFGLSQTNSESLTKSSDFLRLNSAHLHLNSELLHLNAEVLSANAQNLLSNFELLRLSSNLLQCKSAVQDWRELVTNQNLTINNLFAETPYIAFEICEAPIDEQLRWLSNFGTITGLCTTKPIHKMHYGCSELNFEKTVHVVTHMIRRERVISVTFFINSCSKCILSVESWEAFLCCANESINLLEMYVISTTRFPVIVDFGGAEGKTWRSVELKGNVFPLARSQLDTKIKRNTWDHESFVRELPPRVKTLLVNSALDNDIPLCVFVQNDGLPTVHNLGELLITFDNTAKPLLHSCIWEYLTNLKVLAIALSDDFEMDEQKVITFIISMIIHCRFLVRLELWEGCTEQFIATFLNSLSKGKWPAISSPAQSVEPNFNLDTLMLSPLISSKEKASESTTVNLVKELLRSDSLRHLWIGCTEKCEGYANRELMKLFSPAEGFTCKLEVTSGEENFVWQSSLHNHDPCSDNNSTFVFKISSR